MKKMSRFQRWNEGWKKACYFKHDKQVYYKDIPVHDRWAKTEVRKVHLTGATRLSSKGACTTFGLRSHKSPHDIRVEVEFLVEYYVPTRIFSDGSSVGTTKWKHAWSLPTETKFYHDDFKELFSI